MLRIKRSVQASYNTESSFIAAQTAAAKSATGEKPTDAAASQAKDAADPMAGLERDVTGKSKSKAAPGGAPAFVASTLRNTNAHGIDEGEPEAGGAQVNPEAIDIDDEDI